MSENSKQALADFAAAQRRLANAAGVKNAGGYEGDYAVAYQRLVRLGLRPQLRQKYRAQ